MHTFEDVEETRGEKPTGLEGSLGTRAQPLVEKVLTVSKVGKR